MADKTMIYHPEGGGKEYQGDGVKYYAKVIDFDDWPAHEKQGWCRHFTDFGKKKVVKKAAKKKAK